MEVDLVGVVVSAPAITAPLSGVRASAVHVEALREGVVVGALVLGDLLRLSLEIGEVQLLVRRATFAWVTRFDPPSALGNPVPSELVPLLHHRPAGLRERVILPGDRFRLRATVERDGAASPLVADDRSAIRLDEVLPPPG